MVARAIGVDPGDPHQGCTTIRQPAARDCAPIDRYRHSLLILRLTRDMLLDPGVFEQAACVRHLGCQESKATNRRFATKAGVGPAVEDGVLADGDRFAIGTGKG